MSTTVTAAVNVSNLDAETKNIAERHAKKLECARLAAQVKHGADLKYEMNRVDHLNGWHVGANCDELECIFGWSGDMPNSGALGGISRAQYLDRNIDAVSAQMRMRSSMAELESMGTRPAGL